MSVTKLNHLFQKLSDWASYYCGTPQFLILHLIWWTAWFVFEPEKFPFNFLTMLLSLEAIVLAILILNSSNRQGDKDREIIQRDLDLDGASHKTIQKIWEHLNRK